MNNKQQLRKTNEKPSQDKPMKKNSKNLQISLFFAACARCFSMLKSFNIFLQSGHESNYEQEFILFFLLPNIVFQKC